MKKTLSWLVIFSILMGALPACMPVSSIEAPTSERAHLKVGVFNYISSSPLFIARDEGYFEEQGLDVELIDFGSSSNEILPALAARELDLATLTLSVSVFNAISQGSNVKYVADKGFINPENCVTDAWVAGKPALDSGTLSTPLAIKGKNVVFPPGGTVEYSMDILLAQNGLTPNDINATNVSDSAARVEGLKNGSIDVSVLSEPWITRAKMSEAGEVWMPFSDIIPNLSLGVLVFGPGILEDKPDIGSRFMAAYLKAVAQFNQGKTDRNVEIIANFTKLSPEDIKASCWTSFKPDGYIDVDAMLAFQEWAVAKGYMDSALELDQFWTSRFVDEAQKILNK